MAKNWYDQMQTLAEEYMNRKPFSYDMDKDKLYQSVKDNYVKQGRQAMEDTMGQAAGLTGGYASSYGQAVGNQTYQDYLTKLNAQAPEFYDRARAAYDAEGADLMDRIGLAQQMYNTQLSAAAAAGRGSGGGSRGGRSYRYSTGGSGSGNGSGGGEGQEQEEEAKAKDVDYLGLRRTLYTLRQQGRKDEAQQMLDSYAGALSDQQRRDLQGYIDFVPYGSGVDDNTYRGLRQTVSTLRRTGQYSRIEALLDEWQNRLSRQQAQDLMNYGL